MRGNWWALLALVLAGGCGDRLPAGQVLARVDGHDITESEIAAEARAAPAPQAELLGRLVDRTLLVEAARAVRADLTPAYRADVRRAADLLLAQGLRRQIAAGVAVPGERRALAFAASRPWAFARRASVTLVAPDGAAAEADTASLDPATAVAVGEARIGGLLNIGGRRLMVVARRPAPVTPAATLAAARAAMIGEETERRLSALLGVTRANAAIVYQPGFGPAQQ